ncbi:hypothetical protein [Variovorax sp. HJSM1_2]|uniref:hypothetical protein n=1 Tax=Variovorax sp. HJSM1_2 TaxID=3366263 RepID=UPI003BBEE05C
MSTTNPYSMPAVRTRQAWRYKPLALSLLATLTCAAALAQQPTQSMEERLRAQLRVINSQLQQAQNELAVLKAGAAPVVPAAAAAAPEVAELKKALARAESQVAAERQGRVQAADESQQLRAQAQTTVDKANALVAQLRNAYDELLKLARTSEAERQKLATEAATQKTVVAQCEAKNAQLYAVGQELLHAYETMDLGSVLLSRQPFAAQSRVKYEQIAQQYGDRLYAGRFDARSVNATPADAPQAGASAAQPAATP